MKWEYIYAWLGFDEGEELNHYGSLGWELVSIIVEAEGKKAYFKRPLRTKTEDEIMKHFENRYSLT